MSTFTSPVTSSAGGQFSSTLQKYKLEVFKEPRGIIRILQLVFAIVTAVVLKSYEGYIDIKYCNEKNPSSVRLPFKYPFDLSSETASVSCNATSDHPVTVSLMNDFSSEAEFLYTTCWVSIIFVILIALVYIKFRDEYETNGNLALVDFVVSVILAVLWVASFGSWGYGQSELKNFTHPDFLKQNLRYCDATNKAFYINCVGITRGSVSGLTESLIFSFLNFFLWAAGLWFLYKETPWYLQFQRA